MKALERKLLRDLRLMWSQALTIALVVASGVAGFVATFSAYDSLSWSRDRYYAQSRFADVFSSFKRAPQSVQARLQQIDGVAQVHTSITQVVQVGIEGVSDPVRGRLIGLDPRHLPELNRLHLRRGRLPGTSRSGTLEALVSEAFALAHGLQTGARLQALVNGKRQTLQITGIALSPQYIFAGLMGSPDPRGFGIFWVEQEALASAYNMHGEVNQVEVRLAPGASEGAVIADLDRLLSPYGGVSAHGRDEQMSHRMLNAEIREQQVLGTVLPSIFLLVAAFLLHVVLSRQITLQREQIAALKALGYANRDIALHYLRLVLLIAGLGVLLGLGIGAVLGQWFVGLYGEVFRFPELLHRVRVELIVAATGLTVAAALLATWGAVRGTVRLSPAEAMQPPAPGLYRPSLLEHWGWRDRLSPATRMVLRHMQRRPLRVLLTVSGMAASMAVVISGSFWRDSIDLMLRVQFTQVLRGDVSLGLIELTPSSVSQEAARLPHVTELEASRSAAVRLVHGHRVWRGALQGRPAQARLQRIVDLDSVVHPAVPDGLLLTDRLARRLQVHPGQLLRVEVQEGTRQILQLPVSGTVREMMGMGAYIERHSLNRLLGEGDVVNQLTLSVARPHEAELLQRLQQLPRVAMAFSKAVLLRNLQGITARNILIFSAILTVFASVIAIGVVYNQTRIALAERAWELSSLRVLGFTRAEVSGLLLRELALETLMAIPLGLFAGHQLASTIVRLIQTEEFYFSVAIRPATYAFSALSVVLAGAVSAWIVHLRIRQLDLVGVLKTRE
jgi:putative ABC transport system permease protein